MKKVLSLFSALVILVGCMGLGSFSSFAEKKEEVPEIGLNETKAISAVYTTDEENKAEFENSYYYRFTAPSNGNYFFKFDTAYALKSNDPDNPPSAMAMLMDSKGNMAEVGIAVSFASLDAQTVADYKAYGVKNNPSFVAELKADNTYFLAVTNDSEQKYVTNLKIEKHTHTIVKQTRKAEVVSGYNSEGGIYSICSNSYCTYEKLDEEFPAAQSVSISKTKYTYDGKAKKPAVAIALANGKKLSRANYSVKYLNNTKVGKASAVITFKGNYTGKLSKSFTIIPKKTELVKATPRKKAVTVKYKKRKAQVTGYEIQCATNKKFTKNKKTTLVKKNKTTTKTVKGLKSKKVYYVRVRTYKNVGSKKYYSSWTKTAQVRVK
ncbi:MAG: fibronectin type III domain-containing protein [Eubacterium sp.]|nr:fibronectin type III domain-containing protein [Eubacterium sp.]